MFLLLYNSCYCLARRALRPGSLQTKEAKPLVLFEPKAMKAFRSSKTVMSYERNKMMSSNSKMYKMILAGLFLALALTLPFLTGQIPQIGSALCPMHLPVLLCGFFCGPFYGAIVGFVAPLLRFLLFGMPPVVPTGLAMAFELMTYGLVAGFTYEKLPKTKTNVYVSLIVAMIDGRIVWGCARLVLMGLGKAPFGWQAFISGAFLTAIPGIILQIVLIPILVMTLKKSVSGK